MKSTEQLVFNLCSFRPFHNTSRGICTQAMGTLPAAVVGLSNANTITSEWRGMRRLGRHKWHFTATLQRMNQVFNLIGIQASLNYIPIAYLLRCFEIKYKIYEAI